MGKKAQQRKREKTARLSPNSWHPMRGQQRARRKGQDDQGEPRGRPGESQEEGQDDQGEVK